MEERQKEWELEEAFARLDEIIRTLENRDTTLEASFAGYQEGMQLLKICSERLDTVEKKMLVLHENGEAYEFFNGNEETAFGGVGDSGTLSSGRVRNPENGD